MWGGGTKTDKNTLFGKGACLKIPGKCFLPGKKPLRERTRTLKACKNQGIDPKILGAFFAGKKPLRERTHPLKACKNGGVVPKILGACFFARKKAPAGAHASP